MTSENRGEVNPHELVAELKTKFQKPVIILTNEGKYNLDSAAGFKQAGADAFFSFLPPFPTEDFKQTLQKCVATSLTPHVQAVQPNPTHPPRIVVVDDEDWFVDMVGLLVRSWFTDVTLLTFTNKAEALGDLSAKDPDLLMLGMVPLGREILPLLAERNVQYPILATSGYDQEADVRRKAGPKLKLSFIAKPFSMDELYHHLHAHFASAREFRGQVHKYTA